MSNTYLKRDRIGDHARFTRRAVHAFGGAPTITTTSNQARFVDGQTLIVDPTLTLTPAVAPS